LNIKLKSVWEEKLFILTSAVSCLMQFRTHAHVHTHTQPLSDWLEVFAMGTAGPRWSQFSIRGHPLPHPAPHSLLYEHFHAANLVQTIQDCPINKYRRRRQTEGAGVHAGIFKTDPSCLLHWTKSRLALRKSANSCLLTPCSRVLPDKLIVTQLVWKFLASYGT